MSAQEVFKSPNSSLITEGTSMTDFGTMASRSYNEITALNTDRNVCKNTCRELEFSELDSPYSMVRSAVPPHDDIEAQSLTFRTFFLGVLFSAIMAFVNQILSFKDVPVSISGFLILILIYPCGVLMSRYLPSTRFTTFGFNWSINPGPFSTKEHALIYICSMTSSTGAYALNIIVTENVWYGHSFGYVPAFLLTLTTLMLGYSFAGIAREVLIYPAEMIWPSTLVSVTLCRTLHEKEGFTDTMTRGKLYWVLVGCGFVYYMLPGYIMPILSFVPVLCLIAPNNIYANQIGDAVNGLGFLNLSFNWSIISSGYFGSPMATPWPMACNIFVGFVILIWVAVPAGYYSNVWGSGNLPIYSSGIFKENGTAYDVLRIISSDGMFDAEKYAEYGHINLPFQFGVAYGISFISIAVLIVYTLLNNGKAIYEKIRYVDYSGDDIHARLMRKYDEVPMWWYLALFVVILAISIGACEGYKILPWYWLLAAIGLAVVFLIPIGIVQAISNTQPGLNVITQLIIGYGRPGDQLANVAFKVYGYISIYQGLSLISNQKLGHYMKIPPRHVFIVQIVGTIVCAVIQPGVVTWMLSSFKDICTPAGAPWTCTSTNAFYSASIVWGLVGPRRIFGPDSHYSLLVYCFLIGVLLPIPVWYLQKRYPLSLWKHVHLHVMFAGLMQLPPAPITALTSWFFFCTVFNGIIRRYRYGWWQKYAFVTSAALDTSVTIGFLFVYVCFYVTKTNMPFYWGTDTQRCPLAANGGFKNYKDFLPSQQ